MHPGAFEYVGRFATNDAISVIEIGSRDINGTIRSHFPAASWIGLDRIAGPGVDVVGNALDYIPPHLVSHVICCEVFEHFGEWQYLLDVAYRWLIPSGRIIVTCAGIGRSVHSAIDGGDTLHFGEWYQNISERRMTEGLMFSGFRDIDVSGNEYWKDTYATAIK
jgi:hypothetical protein